MTCWSLVKLEIYCVGFVILIKIPPDGGWDGNWSLLFTAPGDIWFLAMVVFGFCVRMEDLENPVQERDIGWHPWLWHCRWEIPRSWIWPQGVSMEKCILLLGGIFCIGVAVWLPMDRYKQDVWWKRRLREVEMKDFLAWLSYVHWEIRMRNFGLIVKSACFCISQVFHVRLPGYQKGVWDVGIFVNLQSLWIHIHLCRAKDEFPSRMHQGFSGMFRGVVSFVHYLEVQVDR